MPPPMSVLRFIVPCLPSPGDRPPSGSNWIHEIKHDGYRLNASLSELVSALRPIRSRPPTIFSEPNLLRLPLHRRRFRVLEFQPVRRPTGPVPRPQPLRDNSLQPHLAGMLEDRQALSCSMCSFRRTPARLFRRMLVNVALRTSIGSRRRSVPFSSRRSKA